MKILILLTLSFFSITGAFAQGTCEGFFAQAPAETAFAQTIASLAHKNLLTSTNSDQHLKNIKTLSLKIFDLNREPLLEEARNTMLYSSRGDHRFVDPALTYEALLKELQDGSIVFSIAPERFLKKSNLHVFKASFHRGKEEVLAFSIRTNGVAAFLDCSFRYRSAQRMEYQAVALQGSRLLSADMSRVVLDSLGDSVTLSRAMDSMERQIWIRGESDFLGSRRYHQRIHFALNYYYFNKFSPYMVQIPKQLLEKFLAEGKLEVNSYDTLEARPTGMADVARTPFGLEIEFVISQDAAKEIAPYLSPAVRQGVLDFQDYLSGP
jgi:hypothetical protein